MLNPVTATEDLWKDPTKTATGQPMLDLGSLVSQTGQQTNPASWQSVWAKMIGNNPMAAQYFAQQGQGAAQTPSIQPT